MSTSLEAEEITEEQIDQMTPKTLKAKIVELKEREREKEEENQRNELRNLIRSGRSVNNSRTVGDPSRRMITDQRVQKLPNLEECSSYDIFRKKLDLWERNINISDAQKGNLIIQSLTDTSKFKKNLSEKFMSKHTVEEMSGDGSLVKVKAFLDAELKEGDLEKAVKKWRDLRSCRRKRGEDIEDYMDRFERSYLELKAAMPTTEIPQELRAIIVLDGANVEGLEETVLLGKVNMDDKTTLLSQMEKALKDVLGRGPCGKSRGTGTGVDGLVRVEAVKKNEGESCLWVGDQKYKAVKKKVKNKKGTDGKVLTCFTCKSEYHFSQDCPKAKEEGDKPKRGEKRQAGAELCQAQTSLG